MALMALAIFLATLVLVVWRPWGLPVGWSALLGALLALAAGVVRLHDVWTVWNIVWDATLTFVGILVVSSVLDASGFFEWAALTIAHRARGRGRLAFVLILALGFMVSAFFSNDGAALILTPIVLEKMKRLQFSARQMIPFLLAGGFIADSTSIPLIISNLVNIISADYYHLGFLRYALRMLVPDLVSFGASLGVTYLYFRREIPASYDVGALPAPASAIRDRSMFKFSWWMLGVMTLGYVASEIAHVPVSAVEGAIAIAFLIAGWRTRTADPRRVLREAPWSIVVFSVGMYLVVYGLERAHLTDWLTRLVQMTSHANLFWGVMAMGVLSACLSCVMNNLPSVMLGLLAIQHTGLPVSDQVALALANVVGCDLGPKMTPIGSLATLLWLHVLESRGVRITVSAFMRAGLAFTWPTLLTVLASMYGWLWLVRHLS
ncbi:Arsenical pump membrane protein [Alicyclobacillus acidocaldarius subsp. acidocaldarius DSM 446]|uniref:Arsenical pump membrane protein n=2 Tax=Alicyclobacillus acidocaldarius TaxID=405212 RepID=C8WR41_ALIAD|nr:Arsenical pump membrane protein [Alicyclobacillus acidocaldarius subsp. acidocaldarius DSM 446]